MSAEGSLKKLTEWALWFAENKDRDRDNQRDHLFLKDAIDELGGIIADLIGEVRELQGAPRESMRDSLIWAPRGVRATNRARYGT